MDVLEPYLIATWLPQALTYDIVATRIAYEYLDNAHKRAERPDQSRMAGGEEQARSALKPLECVSR